MPNPVLTKAIDLLANRRDLSIEQSAAVLAEIMGGNASDTERLTLQLASQARALGVDLDPETVVLLQQVMEGRVRARMA